jgi:plasmid replication initiation protein
MKIDNLDLIQSYILTSAKYDYTVYEKRILYRIIELMQDYTAGKKLNQKYSIRKTIFDDIDITMPISAFMTEGDDSNYSRTKKALLSLNGKTVEYKDKNTWAAYNLIERPEIHYSGGYASFRISPKIAKAFLDFSKGYSKYELVTAMNFVSSYSMRFYELFSENKQPITYRIDSLKIMFKLEDKYKLNADFIRRVVEPSKKELDATSPYSFKYEIIKKGKAMDSIRFFPIYQPQNRDEKLERKKLEKTVSLGHDIEYITIKYLKENYFFTDEELKNNRTVLVAAAKTIDLMLFASELKSKAEDKANPKGWLINAIKKQLEQKSKL